MISNIPKPPPTQRRFRSAWSELDYLCTKIRYWRYTRKQRGRAEGYLSRLERVLHQLPENDLAIIRAEGWALVHELKGHIDEAIAYREREIQLMERLHREAELPRYDATARKYLLQNCDRRALRQRRRILQDLKREASQQVNPVHTTEVFPG